MEAKLIELRKKLDKFKSWIIEPRLYIVEELDAIKNEIDIFTEKFLMRNFLSQTLNDTQKLHAQNKINSNRKQMIDEVEAFEKKILSNLPSNELEFGLNQKLKSCISDLDSKLIGLESSTTYFEYDLNCAIYEFDCAIKQKSSLMFINVFLLKKILNLHEYDENEVNEKLDLFDIMKFKSEKVGQETVTEEGDVAFKCPLVHFELDSTMFGVLICFDDCGSKIDFAYVFLFKF